MFKLKYLCVMFVAAALGACGGSDHSIVPAGGAGGGGSSQTVATVSVVTSAAEIPSDGSADASITAIVRDAGNNAIAGVAVSFQASSGGIAAAQPALTDANGRVTATLSTLGDSSVRTITVTASAGGQSANVNVDVVDAISVTTLTLLTSHAQILSDGSNNATLTALVRDNNNNVLSGVPIVFSTTSGSIVAANPSVTDANGQVTATLSTLGNPQNRTITVTAKTGSLTQTVTVDVVGTTLTVSGPGSLPQTDTGNYTVLLRDAGGTGISATAIDLSSQNGNTLSAAQVTTNATGSASFTMTPTVGGMDILTANGLGLVAQKNVSVSTDTFQFTLPAPATEIPLGTVQTVTVNWQTSGVPVADGSIVSFSTTRGTLSAASAPTSAGLASVTVSASNAGPAVITATAEDGTSTQLVVEFVATVAAEIDVQASPLSVGPEEQSTITAVVRDASGNLVKNQVVDFTFVDVTGGSLSVAQATTDSQGRAQTFYTASSQTSAADGVAITATVQGTAIADTVNLTVAQRELFMSIGTGNEIFEPNSAQYRVEYIVQVTDSQGNGVEGAQVQVNVLSLTYNKGYRTVPPGESSWTTVVTATCPDEDVDRDGQLDPGEDANGSGLIEAGNIATVSVQGQGGGTFTSDQNGFGLIDLYYPQEYAYYLRVRMTATTAVSGTEFAESTSFTLAGAASDFNSVASAPPGVESPFGTSATCADTL